MCAACVKVCKKRLVQRASGNWDCGSKTGHSCSHRLVPRPAPSPCEGPGPGTPGDPWVIMQRSRQQSFQLKRQTERVRDPCKTNWHTTEPAQFKKKDRVNVGRILTEMWLKKMTTSFNKHMSQSGMWSSEESTVSAAEVSVTCLIPMLFLWGWARWLPNWPPWRALPTIY